MARYIHGWIEHKIPGSLPGETLWEAVVNIRHFLGVIKDYAGFECIFGTEGYMGL